MLSKIIHEFSLKVFDAFLNCRFTHFPNEDYPLLINFIVSKWSNHQLKITKNRNIWLRIDGNAIAALGHNLKIRRSIIRSWEKNCADIYSLRKKWWFENYTPELGDTILDIGAGMGEDTLLFSKEVGKEGTVISVEAHPDTYHALEVACAFSGASNVILLNVAATQFKQQLVMSNLPEDEWQNNSIKELDTNATQSPAENIVEGIPLDDCTCIQKYHKIHFLKMNIEGAEIEALLGARETLKKTENICLCCHDFLGPETATKARVCEILSNSGFILSFTDPSSPPWQKDFVYGKKVCN